MTEPTEKPESSCSFENGGVTFLITEVRPNEMGPPPYPKVDPKRISWPEGLTPPWEKKNPPQNPPKFDESK